MLATARFRVLASNTRTAQDGKTWLDVYCLQDGRREVVQAYADPATLGGEIPQAGDLIDAAVLAYGRRGDAGLSVRIDAFVQATAGTPLGSPVPAASA